MRDKWSLISGASTAEAQQRVAIEIAQQFLALSGKSTEYIVTGIVNAPVLSAAMTNENEPWIELSKKLGQLAGRFLKGELHTIIHSQTVGRGMQDKQFIHTAVLVGILTGQTKNGLNLVNAPTLAQEIGVELQESHVDDENKAVVVKVGEHTIKGNLLQNKIKKLSTSFSFIYEVNTYIGLIDIIDKILILFLRILDFILYISNNFLKKQIVKKTDVCRNRTRQWIAAARSRRRRLCKRHRVKGSHVPVSCEPGAGHG